MAVIDPTKQSDRDNYKLLIGSVLPRPIALITTLSEDGVLNAAPFSFFTIISSSPPLLCVSVQRRDRAMKDTARNAVNRGELVIHVVDEHNVERANRAAANLPPDESEIELAGFTPVPSSSIRVPGLAEAQVRMECRLEHAFEIGGDGEAPSCDLLIAHVVLFHIKDDLLEHGRIDVQQLAPVSRLAGNSYAALGRIWSMDRPS